MISHKLNSDLLHYSIAIILTLCVGSIIFFQLPISEPTQIYFLILVAGIIGIPHGRTDFIIIRKISKSKIQIIYYLFLYLAVVILVFYLWQHIGLVLFLVFLLFSIYHFGSQDCKSHKIKNSALKIIAGSIIILIPLFFHQETSFYYNTLIGMNFFHNIEANLSVIIFSILIYLSYLIFKKLYLFFLETVILISLLALLPPLISFTLYFSLWHTPRHYLEEISELSPDEKLGNIFIILIISFSILFSLAAFLIVGADSYKLSFKNEGVIFFKLIIGLTISHVLLNEAKSKLIRESEIN